MSIQNNDNSGSFLTGFTVGLFAGAAAYFFFATDRGDELHLKLKKEWEQASEKLAEKGVIEDKNLKLKDLAASFFEKISTACSSKSISKSGVKKKKISKKKSSPKRLHKKTGLKFKGV
ncbi:MAG: hypothetical protein PVJ09_03085 [Candidatus Woesebacteria bacterium]